MTSKRLPRDPAPDSTLPWLLDPYGFIASRCRRLGADAFETRLLLRKTVCLMGPEAARLVYEDPRFVRRGAAPGRIQKTLFGRGGVQGLDGEAHRHRKAMFLSFMTPQGIDALARLFELRLREQARRWTSLSAVPLCDELQEALCRAVCDWSGVRLSQADVPRRTRELSRLFRKAGSVGPAHWLARRDRHRADRWAADLIEETRLHARATPVTVLESIAEHRDLDGERLTPHDAGVELLNVLRPTIAIAVYITQAIVALGRHPSCRTRLRDDDGTYAQLFVQEVRRHYPFFPAVAARLSEDVDWSGYRLPKGRRVLLDLYGTLHDSRTWREPDTFEPERFRDQDVDPFTLIPQGGGDHETNHRCAGEWITIALMKVALRFLRA